MLNLKFIVQIKQTTIIKKIKTSFNVSKVNITTKKIKNHNYVTCIIFILKLNRDKFLVTKFKIVVCLLSVKINLYPETY